MILLFDHRFSRHFPDYFTLYLTCVIGRSNNGPYLCCVIILDHVPSLNDSILNHSPCDLVFDQFFLVLLADIKISCDALQIYLRLSDDLSRGLFLSNFG